MKTTIIIVLMFISNFGISQTLDDFYKSSDSFFRSYVCKGKVDYKSILQNPKELNAIITSIESVSVSDNHKNTYMSFWINVYNLLVINEVVSNYPLNSPLDVNGFFDKKKHNVAGGSYTLNEIENDLLRAKFNDPRIHFVLVCGANGCPPIINEAYTPDNLERKLTEQTRKSINGNFVRINLKRKKVQVSQIMEWYKKDFVLDGNEIDFLNKYLDEPISTKFKLSYFEYDWSLNQK